MTRAQELMESINAAFKSEVVSLASDPKHKVKYVPSGLLPFDILLPGGLPRGRMIEMYGGPSTLKSYFVYCAIAETQRQGGVCALLDTERTFDPDWAESVGVDLSNLVMPPADTGEEAFDMAQILVQEGIDLLGFDSIAAAQPQTYDDNPLKDNKIQPGRHAALFSLGLRKVTSKNRGTTILFTNQTRTSIGVTFGNPEVTPGGNAPMFYSSLRMRMQPAGKLHTPIKYWDGDKYVEGKQQVGQKFRVEMTKSKLSNPYGIVMFDWSLTDNCIDIPRFLIAQGLEIGVVQRPNATTWEFAGQIIRGKDNFMEAIATNDELRGELEWAVRRHHGLPTAGTKRMKKVSSSRGKAQPQIQRKPVVVKRKVASSKS